MKNKSLYHYYYVHFVADIADQQGKHLYSELVHGRVAIPTWLYRGSYQESLPNLGKYTQ